MYKNELRKYCCRKTGAAAGIPVGGRAVAVPYAPGEVPVCLSPVAPGGFCLFGAGKRPVWGLEENTVAQYLTEMQKFMQWLQAEYGLEQVEPEKVTIAQIRRYISYLKNERDNKPPTRNVKVSVLKSYYQFLVLIEYLEEEDNPALYIRKAKEAKPLPVYLTLEESQALLQASLVNTSMPQRDYAMMRFFLNTACRMAEFVGFGLDNLDLEDNSCRSGRH